MSVLMSCQMATRTPWSLTLASRFLSMARRTWKWHKARCRSPDAMSPSNTDLQPGYTGTLMKKYGKSF